MNRYLANLCADGISFSHATDDRPDQTSFPPHIHNDYELYVFIEGNAGYTVENAVYALRPYDMLLIPPAQFHCLNLLSPKPYRRMVFNFTESAVLPAVRPLLTRHRFFRLGRDSEIVHILYKLCDNCAVREEADNRALLPAVLSEILLDTKYLSPEQSAVRAGPAGAIADYINEHIREPLSVRRIADALYLSPSYVSHVFSAQYRMGVMQFVRRKKVFAAEQLIVEGAKPIEAAYACGFGDYATFYRAYRQLLNRAPSDTK